MVELKFELVLAHLQQVQQLLLVEMTIVKSLQLKKMVQAVLVPLFLQLKKKVSGFLLQKMMAQVTLAKFQYEFLTLTRLLLLFTLTPLPHLTQQSPTLISHFQ